MGRVEGVLVMRFAAGRVLARHLRYSKYVVPLVAALALVIAGGASAFVVSHASSHVVQPQPPPGSCHVRGNYPFNMPDLHCTPGALNSAVTQATITTRSVVVGTPAAFARPRA